MVGERERRRHAAGERLERRILEVRVDPDHAVGTALEAGGLLGEPAR